MWLKSWLSHLWHLSEVISPLLKLEEYRLCNGLAGAWPSLIFWRHFTVVVLYGIHIWFHSFLQLSSCRVVFPPPPVSDTKWGTSTADFGGPVTIITSSRFAFCHQWQAGHKATTNFPFAEDAWRRVSKLQAVWMPSIPLLDARACSTKQVHVSSCSVQQFILLGNILKQVLEEHTTWFLLCSPV